MSLPDIMTVCYLAKRLSRDVRTAGTVDVVGRLVRRRPLGPAAACVCVPVDAAAAFTVISRHHQTSPVERGVYQRLG